MRLIRIVLTILTALVVGQSCIEPFTPETSGYEEMLFIEGLISDNPLIPARVIISRTVPLDKDSKEMTRLISGADVSVMCDDGSVYPFTETGPGIYKYIIDNLTLEQDKSYRLLIQTVDGKIFESDYEPYFPSPPIDSITSSSEIVEMSEIDPGAHGIQFYAHATSLDQNPLYLRWILDATYQYYVPFYSSHIWIGGTLEEYYNHDVIVCWKDIQIEGIFIDDSYGLTQNRVANAKLNFVSQYGDQLMLKYSLHTYQLSISESSYQFWRNLAKLVYETGGLYETQPFRLEGNVHCTSDSEVNVAGIFEVAGVSELRVFVKKPTDFTIYPRHCQLDTIGTERLPWQAVLEGSYVIEMEPGLFMTAPNYCFDCTLRGGTIIRPPFWE